MTIGLFPGQGLPAATVLDALPPDDPHVRAASDALSSDVRDRVEAVVRSEGAVLPTSLAQPAIFVASFVAWRKARAEGRTFALLAGHSLGEYSALAAADALSFEDAVRAVAARGEAMHAAAGAAPGGMAAIIDLELDAVDTVARDSGALVANDNAPGQVVLSGTQEQLERAASLARAAGGRVRPLETAASFHHPAMAPARDALERFLADVPVSEPVVPVVSNVTARPYGPDDDVRALLVRQVTSPVRFRESLEWAWSQGVRSFDDLGPGRVVGGLARRTFRRLEADDAPPRK